MHNFQGVYQDFFFKYESKQTERSHAGRSELLSSKIAKPP